MLQSIFDYEHAEHPNPPFAVTEAELTNPLQNPVIARVRFQEVGGYI